MFDIYTGLKVLLFGIEEKPVDEVLNTRNIFYASQRQNIKESIGFIEVFENKKISMI